MCFTVLSLRISVEDCIKEYELPKNSMDKYSISTSCVTVNLIFCSSWEIHR